MIKERIRIFTHTDLDGVGSVVLMNALSTKTECINYTSHNYQNIDKSIIDFYESDEYLEYDKVYITDISVREEKAIKAIIEMRKSIEVLLFDHHETAKELNKYDWATVIPNNTQEKDTCGTELFYRYLLELYKNDDYISGILNNMATIKYVELTRSYDTWDWAATNNEEANDLNKLFSINKKYEFIDEMSSIIKYNKDIFSVESESMLKAYENIYQKYAYRKLKEVKHCHINGEVAGVVFAEDYQSALAHDMLDKIQIIDVAVLVNPSTGQVSFRSREGGPNVRVIAEERNGGGHTNASGCYLGDKFVEKLELLLCEELGCE